MIRRIFCVLLIVLGAGLDSYFYVFRFMADGTAFPVAIAAALALELLLAFAVWNAQKSKLFTGVAIAITLYAVIQTSAGQTFSLLSRDAGAGDTTATTKTLMAEEQKNLDRLDSEYQTITKQLQSVQTVEDRAAYGVTVYRMTARMADLEKARSAASSRLSILADKAGEKEIAKVKGMSIYDFYASMPHWSGMDWLKFIFHTLLSILLALMTPIGILTWDVKSAQRIMKKSSVTGKEIDEFVRRCWKKVVIGTGDKILKEADFFDWCERDGVVVSPGVYAECFRRALDLGIITREGVAVVKDPELIRQKIQKGK